MTQAHSQAVIDDILRRIASGESLSSICQETGMPDASTVLYWRHTRPEFDKAYLLARESQAEALFEEMLAIADDGSNDWMEKELRSGRIITVLDKEAVQRSKLRLETRRWLLAVMAPKRYREKTQVDLTSSDGSMSPANMTDEQKAAKLTAIHQAAMNRIKAPVDDGSDLV